MGWSGGTGSFGEENRGTFLAPWCPLGTEGWDGQVGQGVLLRKFVSTA